MVFGWVFVYVYGMNDDYMCPFRIVKYHGALCMFHKKIFTEGFVERFLFQKTNTLF